MRRRVILVPLLVAGFASLTAAPAQGAHGCPSSATGTGSVTCTPTDLVPDGAVSRLWMLPPGFTGTPDANLTSAQKRAQGWVEADDSAPVASTEAQLSAAQESATNTYGTDLASVTPDGTDTGTGTPPDFDEAAVDHPLAETPTMDQGDDPQSAVVDRR